MLVGAKLGAKAGEVPFIEGAKDETAEGMAKMVADENGIPMPEQMVNPKQPLKQVTKKIFRFWRREHLD